MFRIVKLIKCKDCKRNGIQEYCNQCLDKKKKLCSSETNTINS